MDNCPPMLCTGLDCAVVTERNGCQVCQVFFILSFAVLRIVLECFKFPIINGIVSVHFVSGFIHATPVFPSVRPVSCVAAWRQRQFHSQCHCHTLFPSPILPLARESSPPLFTASFPLLLVQGTFLPNQVCLQCQTFGMKNFTIRIILA